jgi:hypothetical protein
VDHDAPAKAAGRQTQNGDQQRGHVGGLTGVPADRLAAAEREAMLDQILTDLWKGKLTRDVAVGRIMAKLGMSESRARDEVDGFLRD